MHPILRIAISYGVMWCVLQAMFHKSGGLMGFNVTATAWSLANAAMLISFILIPFLQEYESTVAPLTPKQEGEVVYFLGTMVFIQGLGITLAGFVHGN